MVVEFIVNAIKNVSKDIRTKYKKEDL